MRMAGAVPVSGAAVRAPEGAFVVTPSCRGAQWGAVLVSGAAVRAPGGAFVATPSCHSARWGAVVVSGAAVQTFENIFVLPPLGLGAPVQWVVASQYAAKLDHPIPTS